MKLFDTIKTYCEEYLTGGVASKDLNLKKIQDCISSASFTDFYELKSERTHVVQQLSQWPDDTYPYYLKEQLIEEIDDILALCHAYKFHDEKSSFPSEITDKVLEVAFNKLENNFTSQGDKDDYINSLYRIMAKWIKISPTVKHDNFQLQTIFDQIISKNTKMAICYVRMLIMRFKFKSRCDTDEYICIYSNIERLEQAFLKKYFLIKYTAPTEIHKISYTHLFECVIKSYIKNDCLREFFELSFLLIDRDVHYNLEKIAHTCIELSQNCSQDMKIQLYGFLMLHKYQNIRDWVNFQEINYDSADFNLQHVLRYYSTSSIICINKESSEEEKRASLHSLFFYLDKDTLPLEDAVEKIGLELNARIQILEDLVNRYNNKPDINSAIHQLIQYYYFNTLMHPENSIQDINKAIQISDSIEVTGESSNIIADMLEKRLEYYAKKEGSIEQLKIYARLVKVKFSVDAFNYLHKHDFNNLAKHISYNYQIYLDSLFGSTVRHQPNEHRTQDNILAISTELYNQVTQGDFGNDFKRLMLFYHCIVLFSFDNVGRKDVLNKLCTLKPESLTCYQCLIIAQKIAFFSGLNINLFEIHKVDNKFVATKDVMSDFSNNQYLRKYIDFLSSFLSSDKQIEFSVIYPDGSKKHELIWVWTLRNVYKTYVDDVKLVVSSTDVYLENLLGGVSDYYYRLKQLTFLSHVIEPASGITFLEKAYKHRYNSYDIHMISDEDRDDLFIALFQYVVDIQLSYNISPLWDLISFNTRCINYSCSNVENYTPANLEKTQNAIKEIFNALIPQIEQMDLNKFIVNVNKLIEAFKYNSFNRCISDEFAVKMMARILSNSNYRESNRLIESRFFNCLTYAKNAFTQLIHYRITHYQVSFQFSTLLTMQGASFLQRNPNCKQILIDAIVSAFDALGSIDNSSKEHIKRLKEDLNYLVETFELTNEYLRGSRLPEIYKNLTLLLTDQGTQHLMRQTQMNAAQQTHTNNQSQDLELKTLK